MFCCKVLFRALVYSRSHPIMPKSTLSTEMCMYIVDRVLFCPIIQIYSRSCTKYSIFNAQYLVIFFWYFLTVLKWDASVPLIYLQILVVDVYLFYKNETVCRDKFSYYVKTAISKFKKSFFCLNWLQYSLMHKKVHWNLVFRGALGPSVRSTAELYE